MRPNGWHVVRGFLMGCAEVVPGISGGTIALIVGIYDRLLLAIRGMFGAAVAAVRLDFEGARTRLGEVSWALILPLMLGMAVALVAGSAIIPPLLDEYPEETSALFFGLILASLIVPWRMWHRRLPLHWVVAVVAALAAFFLTGLPEREITDPSYLLVFGAAAFAICALTLPGVSGSYLLLAIGLYEPTLDAVDSRDLAYLAVFAAGAVVGLGLFARTLVMLLREHRDITVAALLGLMVGSLRALWPWSTDDGALLAPPSDTGEVMTVVLMAVVGIVAVLALLWFSRGVDESHVLERSEPDERRHDDDGGPATSPDEPALEPAGGERVARTTE